MKYIVAKFGSVSPKKGMSELVFLPEEGAEVVWRTAWFPTDWVNTQVAPGCEIIADHISAGKIERSYVDAAGQTIALKSPKQMIWFRGSVSAIAPDMETLEAPTYAVNEQASAFAQAWRAKQAATTTVSVEDDPFAG